MMDLQAPICPYCNIKSKETTGETIYPHRPDLHHKKFYACEVCKAYVGCHKATGKPFGGLANAKLRSARSRAHEAFDCLWRRAKTNSARTKAYSVLAKIMGIDVKSCHIGMFSEDQCELTINACAKQLITPALIEQE